MQGIDRNSIDLFALFVLLVAIIELAFIISQIRKHTEEVDEDTVPEDEIRKH